jgi:hypothetical protein
MPLQAEAAMNSEILRLADIDAITNFDKNSAALSNDPRFAQHGGAELAKAAYSRGIYESVSTNKGLPVDMVAYDAKLSDRACIVKLPDIPDSLKRMKPGCKKRPPFGSGFRPS